MKKRPEPAGAPQLEIAPMLDVTFLLLIFFLCSVRFKTLEGRFDALLPKTGVALAPEIAEPIEVRIRHQGGISTIYVARKPVVRIDSVGPSREIVLPSLLERLRRLHSLIREAPCVIDAEAGTPYGHVVAVIDTAMEAKLPRITFADRAPGRR